MYLTVFRALTMTGNALVSREPLLLGLLCLLIAAPSLCQDKGKNICIDHNFLTSLSVGVWWNEWKNEWWKDGISCRKGIYIYMYVIDIFNIGATFESFELLSKFFCNVTHLNIVCKFKRILGPYLPW